MRRILAALLLVSSLSTGALGADASTNVARTSVPAASPSQVVPSIPTLQQILDRYVEATGGKEALGRLKTREMKGTIEVTALGASAKFTVRSKAPNKQVSGFELGGFGSVKEGFDGAVAWSSMPFQGVKKKTGSELARARRSTVFPRELRLKEAYDRLEVRGAGKVGAANTWVVEGILKEGQPDRFHFDQGSGLLLREETLVSSDAGEMVFRADYEDYRVVDGVKVAHVMRVPEPKEVGFLIRFEEVRHNVEIPDAEFAEPRE